MRRARLWIVVSVVVVLVVVNVAVWLSLPWIVRWAATRGIRSATGRETTIGRVEVGLLRGRLVVHGLRVAGQRGSPDLLNLERLEAHFRLLPLLGGRLRLDAVTLVAPVVHLARDPSGRLDIADILARLGKGQPAKEPMDILLGRLDVARGAATFDDRAVTPAHRWDVAGLTVAVRDIATRSDEARGTASVALTVDGTPVALEASEIRVRRPRAKATVRVTGFDLAPVWAYIGGDPAVRPSGGRFTTRLDVDHSVDTGTRAGGEVTLDALALLRRGQDEPLVFTPSLRMTARDILYKDGVVTAARLEAMGDPTVVDASVTPPQRFPIDGLHVVVEDISHPSRAPARVTVTAGLPSGGTLDVRGTVVPEPVAADVDVTLANVDVKLAGPYVPEVAPITPGDGRLRTALHVTFGADARLGIDGDVWAEGFVLMRKGQTQPFVTHPRLTVTIAGASLQDGAFSVRRLALSGPPTIVDGTVTPPQRFTFSVLDLVVEDGAWPAQAPARVSMRGEEGGGVVTATGTFHPGTLAADVRATIKALDLTRAAGYVPPDAPVSLARGKLEASVRLTHDRARGVGLTGDGALVDLAVTRKGEAAPFVSDARLAFTVGDLVVKDGATSVKRVTVRGAPALADGSVSPARQLLALRGLSVEASNLAWPEGGPAPVRIGVELPDSGTVTVAGTVAPRARRAEMRVDMQDAALGAYGVWLPIAGPVDGRASAGLDVTASFADALALTARGTTEVKNVTLGRDPAPVTIAAASVTGIDLDWPKRLRIERATVSKPVGLIERDKAGSFPIRALFAPRQATPETPAAPTPAPSSAPPAPAQAPTEAPPGPALAIDIGEIVIEDGDVRFVDRSTTPFFSQEISRLAVTLKGFRNEPDARADVSAQAVVGSGGALQLAGQIAPLGRPFYLDVSGELRDIAVTQANPYMRWYSGWIARSGSVSTKLHYRVVGDALEASNDVRVQRIRVEKAADDPASANKRVGLPLGLIVAMITDSRGDISFQVPVTGQLGAPGFSFGDAIWAAVRNVLVNVAAAPFRAIGKLFGSGKSEPEEFKVDPVPFAAGSADVTAEAQQQLQRVADFMRASPYVKLAIGPVVSAPDVASLKTQEVVARIQRVQREQKLTDFSAAAMALYAQAQPDGPAPKTVEDAVAALREREPAPDEAVRRLGARRAEATKLSLVQTAGIEAARLEERASDVRASDTAPGRVEFELLP